MRIGMGYDVHAFAENRKLILGGVEIPHEKGLLGHSDADVLVHSVMDAILGALGERDIGYHFPDTDAQYKDISSLELLNQVAKMMKKSGHRIGNIDITLVAEEPKISPYIPEMKNILAKHLDCKKNIINIKATTTEGLGFVGHKEGIACYCICLLTFH